MFVRETLSRAARKNSHLQEAAHSSRKPAEERENRLALSISSLSHSNLMAQIDFNRRRLGFGLCCWAKRSSISVQIIGPIGASKKLPHLA